MIEYSHSAGNESYRRKLAEYYTKSGIGIDYQPDPDHYRRFRGHPFALMSTVNPGGEIIIPEPYYANYNGFSIAAGVKVVPVTSSIENNFALPPVEEFEKHIGPKTRGILICNPNNPTGYLYSREEIEALGRLAKKHDLFLYADEVYREFCYDGRNIFPS